MKNLFKIKSNYFIRFSFIIIVLLFVFSADFAFAHRVVVFAWLEGDTVFTESQFPDGRKIADGQVNVFDMEKNLLLEGKTDQNGEFSFKIPKITALNIILDAGMGHQGQWKLSEDEIRSSMGISGREPDSEKPEVRPNSSKASPAVPSGSLIPENAIQDQKTAVQLNEAQLDQIVEKAVEKALEKKLQPVTRMLAQTLARMQNSGPTVNDIFGGIGYILGLMGVGAYFLSRKKS